MEATIGPVCKREPKIAEDSRKNLLANLADAVGIEPDLPQSFLLFIAVEQLPAAARAAPHRRIQTSTEIKGY